MQRQQSQQQQEQPSAEDEDEQSATPVTAPTTTKATATILKSSPAELKRPIRDAERELVSFRAQICEQANRFDDMVELVKEFCQSYENLTNDERNMLSCAYKNVIGFRRTSWRVLNEALEASKAPGETAGKEASVGSVAKDWRDGSNSNGDPIGATNGHGGAASAAAKYKPTVIRSLLAGIEGELKVHCNEIISILDKRLIPSSSGESRVFYYKMKGDYLRYLCEICTGPERKDKANESLLAYKTASDRATIELPPTHPVRLGLVLNFSVFYYDIMRSPERSCRLAKQAFDDAIAELDTLSEESYRDSTIIMQLLRDNLNLWESEKSFALELNQQQQQQQQQLQQQQQQQQQQ